jgi:preprotein translocase subunit SecG
VFGFLLALVILDGLLLSVIVLLQAGKGDGLAAMGGGGGTIADGMMGGRQAATLLTKATWITGGLFLGLLLVLSVMSSRAQAPQSVLQQEFQSAPAPLVPGAIDPTAPPPTDPGGAGADPAAGTGQPPAGGAPDTSGG